MLTEEQLHEALGEFNVRRAAGSRLPFGEVLVELELLTRPQLQDLLEAQGGRKAPRQIIPGFELIRKLGEGGMGATYLARQVSMQRLVALKILRRNLSRNDEFSDRFRREARLAGMLNHVNIVQAIDVGEGGGYHYLVMEYVEGKTVRDLLPVNGAMDEELALHIAIQMARALAYAHQHDIVHRDIKPENILVTAENVAKLCDFGLAKQSEADSHLTQAGMAMGTPHYISPEQARGKSDVDIRGDIYSLGATLYRLVTGTTPFSGPTAAVVMSKHLSEQLPWPQDVNPDASEAVSRLIDKMMAKDREDRYQTPEDLLEDLELVIDGRLPRHASLGGGRSSLAKRGTRPVKPRPGRHATTRHQQTRLRDPAADRETRPGRRHRAGGRKKSLPTPALLAIGTALLLLAGGGAYPLLREKEVNPPERPANPPTTGGGGNEQAGMREFEAAEKWWRDNPGKFAGALHRFRRIQHGKTGLLAMKIEHAVDRVRAARARAAEPVADTHAIQAAFAWAPDPPREANRPSQLTWAPSGQALAFEPGKVYILAVQVAFKAGRNGRWYLQYQEDYDRATPGKWKTVANRGVWRTEAKRRLHLANAKEVHPNWYSMPVKDGFRTASGEFSDDDDGLTDNYSKGHCAELWYAIRAEKEAAGHRYRFRLSLAGTVIDYQSFPVAVPAAK